ncbi:MAG: ATP-binding cassette domain-containing protein, partial [Myxococcota bacterium]
MTGVLAVDLLMGAALEVRGLTTVFRDGSDRIHAVNDVSFSVGGGQLLAIVGASGCGKSVLLQSILGLVRATPGVVGGQVILRFRDGTEHRPYEGIERANEGRSAPSPRWRATVEHRFRARRGRR